MDILEKIAGTRRKSIAEKGYTQGVAVPEKREVPLIPLGVDPFVICEIKRSSPSKGKISAISDPVRQAEAYVNKGIRNISILTEEDHFSGSLEDLMAVKRTFPRIAVLRKDFLLEKEDIDVSFRAGADAVLLIAALLEREKLDELYRYAHSMNLSVLMEVHNEDEIDKVRSLKPAITGINTRNLKTFKIDRALPLRLKNRIDWETALVYESGISSYSDALVPFQSGFSGILVGEAVVRDTGLIDDLIRASGKKGENSFWSRLYKRADSIWPLVKICGITNRDDAAAAVSLGADILGFVLADSPRKADPGFIKSIKDLNVLKAAVVVTEGPDLDKEVIELLENGYIDAVQFHGSEDPGFLKNFPFPFYKALRLKSADDAQKVKLYPGPRVLVDAWSGSAYGGTGKRISPDLVKKVSEEGPLWLAGGLSPENVRSVTAEFKPELIDVSSSLESGKGKKDHDKMKLFFSELKYGSI